ncbi:MAG: serine/threonine-protein kinase, partial [Gemmataceae bacterium]
LEDGTVPPLISGYRIESILGRGGMGTVYKATQESLDRPVALKVMSSHWTGDPVFLARFTREAYAAAQLNHTNIVQIYDIGVVDETRFFSMEYVPGESLADVISKRGKLDAETAVSYILQAARGLKHAHDRGMIHRDIKPDNLLLSDQGIVKVADLGLVKTPDLSPQADRLIGSSAGMPHQPKEMTGVRMALGTPAYMSPEQCRDAAMVDHRADIYSLGCTLYVLVTGKPPFDAETAVELMTKQAYQPLVPPEQIAERVPKELSAVIQKMMAKEPTERFATMGDVVRTLEQWLGVHHTGAFSPRDDQIAALEQSVREYHTLPSVVLRERVVTGMLSACVMMMIILTFVGRIGWAFGIAGMLLQAALVHFLLLGLARRTYLFRRVNQFIAGMTFGDCIVFAGGLAMFGVFLWVLNIFWLWVGFGMIGAALAIARRVGLDRAVEFDRLNPLRNGNRLLRRLRSQGLDEEHIRMFVAKYSGRRWEEYFEEHFGFEAKLQTRALLMRGGVAGERDTFAAWREPILRLMAEVEKERRGRREKKLLIATEQARLEARGVNERTAQATAERTAEQMIQQASAIRHAEAAAAAGQSPMARAGLPNVQSLVENEAIPAEPEDAVTFLVYLWTGPHIRAILATVLLSACAAWAVQNALFDRETAILAADTFRGTAGGFVMQPLVVPGIPEEYTCWVHNVNPGWAGILLLASLFYRGHRTAILVLVGAAVTLFGTQLGIRTVEPIQDYHVSLMLGTMLALVGYRLGRP